VEAVETAVKAAALAAGAKVVEGFINAVGVGRQGQPVLCGCGETMQSRGIKRKGLLTLLGRVTYRRCVFRCPRCGRTRCPGDEALGLEGASRSPGVRRQTARLGAKEPFREVAEDLAELANVHLSRKDAERLSEGVGETMEAWMAVERQAVRLQEPPPPEAPRTIETLYVEMDGTGIPMVPWEVQGRPGKQADGTARTREAKVGCVFTQTCLDDDGRPIRDPASTSFVSAIEQAAPFGWRLYAEAVRRGLFEARRVVVLGDAAAWIENLAGTHFGHAQFIIDFYHALEHLGALCRALFERTPKRLTRYRDRWQDYLEDGDVDRIIKQAEVFLPKDPKACPEARGELAFFWKHKQYMRYAHYRAQGLFIGSGVVEAGCKHLVGHRLKQSGMEWTVRGANAILALRAVTLSHRAEDFWENRAA
jgi:hypothetical protein